MKNNLQTEAGQANNNEKIDAINQVFTLFKLNYHNQFLKAYAKTEDLNATKRLWLDSLQLHDTSNILLAAKKIIETSEFLPTLRTMIQWCESFANEGLPDVHAAYIEACHAPSPKSDYNWSHPIIYFTGKACDWYFLTTNPEHIAYPIFKQEFEKISQRWRAGERFDIKRIDTLPETSAKPLSNTENKQRIKKLKSLLDD